MSVAEQQIKLNIRALVTELLIAIPWINEIKKLKNPPKPQPSHAIVYNCDLDISLLPQDIPHQMCIP